MGIWYEFQLQEKKEVEGINKYVEYMLDELNDIQVELKILKNKYQDFLGLEKN
jgi:hypothetical protein